MTVDTAPIDPGTIPPHALRRVIETALEEDAPWGDVTSETLIPAEATATATLAAREPGVLSGGAVFVAVMHAVRCGGGHNHRTSLSDAVLAKDNHLAVLLAGGTAIGDAIVAARKRLGHTVHLEVEVDRLDQIEPVVSAGVDPIMLDNVK
ncbi:nicotinate-nucleotide diphosphorylase (carboxylating), partial [Bacillus sp. S34]|nr:nicotinate-nucleotide diphosphorylase (carboxylating) [Bacillus sp. S34]